MGESHRLQEGEAMILVGNRYNIRYEGLIENAIILSRSDSGLDTEFKVEGSLNIYCISGISMVNDIPVSKYPLCPRCHLPLKFSTEDAYATDAGWNNILSCECGYKFIINGDGEVE